MPYGLDEQLQSDVMSALTVDEEQRRKRSLVEALLGTLVGGGEDLAAEAPTRKLSVEGAKPMGALMANGRDPGLMNGASQSWQTGIRPLPGPADTVQAKPPTTAQSKARRSAQIGAIAANPYDNLDSADPQSAALQDRLAGMTLQHPEVRGFEQRNKDRAEAQLQREFAADDNRAESTLALSRKAGATQRRGTDLRSRLVGDDLPGGDAMLALNDQLKPSNNRLGGIRQAERGTTRDSRLNESFARKLQGSAGEDQIALDNEFTARKAAMAEPNRKPGQYAKSVNQPQNLSGAQRLNLQQIGQRSEQSSARNLAALLMGRSGEKLDPGDADLKTLRAYNTGRKQGPTLMEAMMFNREDAQQRRAEGDRNQKLTQLARLTEAYRQSEDPKLKPLIDILSAELAGGVGAPKAGLPKVQDRMSLDDLGVLSGEQGASKLLKNPQAARDAVKSKKDAEEQKKRDEEIEKRKKASPFYGRYGGY